MLYRDAAVEYTRKTGIIIWSIKINDQWRICFTPVEGGRKFKDTEIIDYH